MVLILLKKGDTKMSRRKCVYCGAVISDSPSVAKLVEITTRRRNVIKKWACKTCAKEHK